MNSSSFASMRSSTSTSSARQYVLCFNQDSGKFTITAIVSEELLEAGFVGKVVYVRGEPTQSIAVTNKHWLRFDRFRGQRCSFEDIQTRARKVLSLVYTKTVPGVPDANIAVLKSMLPIRQDLLEGLPPSSVIPLPCYFYEKSVCLARSEERRVGREWRSR